MKSILIIKLGAIGDVIMTMPLALKTKEDGCTVDWICGMTVAPLLNKLTCIDTLFVVDDVKLLTGSKFEQISETLKVWKFLFSRIYDRVIIPYFDTRYHILAYFCRKRVVSFASKQNKYSFIKDRYLANEILKLYDNTNDYKMVSPVYPEIDAPKLEDDIYLEFKNEQYKVLLAPGGAKNILNSDEQRRYPIQQYAEVIQKLNSNNIKPILIGSKDDEWTLVSFSHLNFYSLIGKTTLVQLLSINKDANLLLTHDTGLLHIAKLTGTKVLSLFGPINPVSRLDKNNRKISYIWGGENLYCSPCYDGKKFAACDNNICLKNISPETVTAKIMSLLNG